MGFSLRKLFNRAPPTVSIPLIDLAEVVKPLIYDEEEANKIAFVPPPRKGEVREGTQPKNWTDDLTPESVAEGWRWAAIYLQAAYSDEKPKGDMYHSHYYALKAVETALNKAEPHAKSVEINKEYLSILKVTYPNFEEACHKFKQSARVQEFGERPIVQFRTGQLAQISPLPFNKLPGANHNKVAGQMVAIGANMKAFTDGIDVPPAKHAQLGGYKPYHLRNEL